VLEQQVRYLFAACIESATILGVDEDFRKELIAKHARLAPTQMGSNGRIMEWLKEYKEPEPHHRHISHLWGLYPGDEISPCATPQLAQAARKSLEGRGDLPAIGWSLAHKAALRARLGDGNYAWLLVRKALEPAFGGSPAPDSGGVYPNLFNAGPLFQIDGNFGTTAAIAEMLLQSQDGVIRLLPALPDEWKNGSVRGLQARGGFEVSIAWKEGALTSATLRSTKGEPCRVSYKNEAVELKIKPGKSATVDRTLHMF
jgi:alpha-L-fucosidase 2